MTNNEHKKIGKDTAADAKRKVLKAKKKILKSEKLKGSINQDNKDDLVNPDTMLPKHNQIADLIMQENKIKTVADPDTDPELMYIFRDGYYIRAEETLKELINSTYKNEINTLYKKVEKSIKEKAGNSPGWLTELYRQVKIAINNGCSTHLVNEAMNAIRRQTFVDESTINPKNHIPFQNGNMNIATWELEEHNPDLFFIWQIKANYDPALSKMRLAPKFYKYLLDVYHPLDIPMVLQYLGYSLYPKFPAHKVLAIVGKEGMGKGVITRILDGLLGAGYMSMDLKRLLTSDKFQFSGIKNANVVGDSEVDRKFKKGTVLSFRNFNNLFGSDPLYLEEKFREGEKGKLSVKGIFLSNLPVFSINDAAAFRRLMPIQVKTERSTRDIADIEQIILEERDAIVSILIRYLKALERQNWIFSNQLVNDSVSDLWDHFANSIQYFIDENLIYQEGKELKVDDTYNAYAAWCKAIGMEPAKKQSFTSYVGKTYPKRKVGSRVSRYYVFSNCTMEDNEENTENQDKLDTGKIDIQPSKINAGRCNRYGVQLWYQPLYYLRAGESNSKKCYNNREPSWTRGNASFRTNETWAYELKKHVSNLNKSPRNETIAKNDKKSNQEEKEKEPETVEISPEIKEKAIKKLSLLPDDSYKEVWDKLKVINFLSEILTKDQSKRVITELKKEGKITEEGNSLKRATIFYKSKTEYKGQCREYFKHGDSHFYKLYALNINDTSKEWLSWLLTSEQIGESQYNTLKTASEKEVAK